MVRVAYVELQKIQAENEPQPDTPEVKEDHTDEANLAEVQGPKTAE